MRKPRLRRCNLRDHHFGNTKMSGSRQQQRQVIREKLWPESLNQWNLHYRKFFWEILLQLGKKTFTLERNTGRPELSRSQDRRWDLHWLSNDWVGRTFRSFPSTSETAQQLCYATCRHDQRSEHGSSFISGSSRLERHPWCSLARDNAEKWMARRRIFTWLGQTFHREEVSNSTETK